MIRFISSCRYLNFSMQRKDVFFVLMIAFFYISISLLILSTSRTVNSAEPLTFLEDPGCIEKHLKIMHTSPWFSLIKGMKQKHVIKARQDDEAMFIKFKNRFNDWKLNIKERKKIRFSELRKSLDELLFEVMPMGGINGRAATIELLRIRKKLVSNFKKGLRDPHAIAGLNKALDSSKRLFEDWGENYIGQHRIGCFDSFPIRYSFLRLGHESLSETRRAIRVKKGGRPSEKLKKEFVNQFLREVKKLKSANVSLPNLEQNIAIIRSFLN